MRIAVTGASGRLGKAVCRVLAERQHQLAAWPHSDLDITDTVFVSTALEALKPDWVINCAAMTNVDLCETDKDRALEVNANAVAALGPLAESVGARLCQVSTDYVFAGDPAKAPYGEDDETGPISHYGTSKLLAEDVALRCEGAMVARVALVYGDADIPSFVEKVFQRALAGQDVQASSEMAGSPSYAPEIARAIVTLVEGGKTGMWHVAGAGRATRFDLARLAAETVAPGASNLVRDVPLASLGLVAPRPRDASLRTDKLEREGGVSLRRWEQSVVEWGEQWRQKRKGA